MSVVSAPEHQPLCLGAALDYAERGFSVILLHGIVDGRCTCGKSDCSSPGKHPVGSWKHAQTQRATLEELKQAFRRNPNANVGVVTGAVSGLVVIDIDGQEGFDSLYKLLPEPTLACPTVRTGKGKHFYGRHPGVPLKNFTKVYPGLDGRADGGYVAAPPSRHGSGRSYEWIVQPSDELPELPSELLALFGGSEERKDRTPRKEPGPLGDIMPPIDAPARRVPTELRKYAEKALTDECRVVATAPVGQQEAILSAAGLKMGAYVGARLLDFQSALDALVEAGRQMVNEPRRARWTRSDILQKVADKLRIGELAPKWGPDPRGDKDDQSPPLDIFGETLLTGLPAFPLDALPRQLAEFSADRAERLGVEPALIAMPALAACAAALDDRHKVQVRQYDDGWTESARLWVAVIEEPGGKKTPAINAAIAPAKQIEKTWYDEDLPKQAEYALSLDAYREDTKKYARKDVLDRLFCGDIPIEPQKPPQRRFMVTDTTIEQLTQILADNPAGILAFFDELAVLFGSFDAYRGKSTGRDRASWLELYNGDERLIDRVGRGHLRVPNWSASIIGGIQPERLRKLLPDLTDDGLLQRFIPVFGSGPSRGVDRPPNRAADRAYEHILKTLTCWRSLASVTLIFSPAAHAARERVMERVDAVLALCDTPGPLKNHLNKWEALFARLALVLHSIEAASFSAMGLSIDFMTEISEDTAVRTEKLMLEYLLPNAMRFYGEFYGRSEAVEHACWIAGHILAHRLPSITGRDIGRVYNKCRDARMLEPAMSYLATAGWVVPVSGESVRRPTKWWVDPRVHREFSERGDLERSRRQQEVEKARAARITLRPAA